MKAQGQIAPKAPPQPPDDWQKARLDSVERFMKVHGAWLNEREEALKLKWMIDSHCQTAKQKRAAIVLLSAQVCHWSQLAGDRASDLGDLAEEIALPGVKELVRQESVLQLRAIVDRNQRRMVKKGWPRNKWGEWVSLLHRWLSDWQRGADLRDALGYGETQFRKLTRKLIKSSQIRTEGQDKLFAFAAALSLLKHRLQKTVRNKRARIAEAIWLFAWYSRQKENLPELRAVLVAIGAECAPLPGVVGGSGLFSANGLLNSGKASRLREWERRRGIEEWERRLGID